MPCYRLTVRFAKGHTIVHYYTHESYAHASYWQFANRLPVSERPAFQIEPVYVHTNITEI